ncbi:uncharacterized protein LOC141535110 [Cotesia typhae]|uniref:uncharacterized protein LOC141535110 n=1 Tax=Cotesia typhae TaxID=2053667 RepID=UPI003D69115E
MTATPTMLENRKFWMITKHSRHTEPVSQEGAESWCAYRRAEAEGITSTFKHDYLPLDPEVQEDIKPIYEDLSRYELLDRCKGNNTQNNNESYNGLLWHFSPKHLHNGFKTIELSNNFATAIFNDGYSSILKIFNVMGVIVGPAARDFAALKDHTRIRIADYRQRASSKEGRSSRRKASSAEQALFEEEEGVLYGPGIAD